MHINGQTLKRFREEKAGLSQQAFAHKSGVSKITIGRIERGQAGSCSTATITRIAKALNIEPEQLTKDPDSLSEEEMKEVGYTILKVVLPENTKNAFVMAQQLYGVNIFEQIEMAPLFFTLLAEGSLAWRRQKLIELREGADRLYAVAKDARHLSFANSVYRAEDGAQAEETSIEKRDLFGKEIGKEAFDFGFDASKNNPFADYLRHFAASFDKEIVELDPDGQGLWRFDYGMPDYLIWRAELQRIEGEIDRLAGGDHLARYALKRRHAKTKDVPQELLADDARDERIAWLVGKIPEEEREREKARQKAFDEIVLTLDELNVGGGSDA